MSDIISKTEMIQLAVRLSILSIATYIAVKWMMKQMDPMNNQKKKAAAKAADMLARLEMSKVNLTEYEMIIASHLVDPAEIPISWDKIGGLSATIQEIKETIILPLRRKDLFSECSLLQPPKGVLLHGPPGCGKTMIAKATAKEAGCRFINLDISILTDKWYGESQKLAAAVFSLAVKIQPCIIFIDEIDSFLRSRNMQDHEATAMMKAQFMTLWDGLSTDNQCTVIVMGATNRPQDLDQAILRRMPASFQVPLPDEPQREDILKLVLKSEPVEGVNYKTLAMKSSGFSGSDLKEMCRNASMYRLKEYLRDNPNLELQQPSNSTETDKNFVEKKLRSISHKDLISSLELMKASKV